MVVRIDSVTHIKSKSKEDMSIVECSLPYRSDDRFCGFQHLSPVFLKGHVVLPVGETVEAETENRLISGVLRVVITGFEL